MKYQDKKIATIITTDNQMLLLSYKRKRLTAGLLGNRIRGRWKGVMIVTFRMISCDVTSCGFHDAVWKTYIVD